MANNLEFYAAEMSDCMDACINIGDRSPAFTKGEIIVSFIGEKVVFPAPEGEPEFDNEEGTAVQALIIENDEGEVARRMELMAVDVDMSQETMRSFLLTAMAFGYVHGRLDQISDMVGSNDERFIRARELKSVIQDADGIGSPLPFLDTKSYLTLLESWRGSLKSVDSDNLPLGGAEAMK